MVSSGWGTQSHPVSEELCIVEYKELGVFREHGILREGSRKGLGVIRLNSNNKMIS